MIRLKDFAPERTGVVGAAVYDVKEGGVSGMKISGANVSAAETAARAYQAQSGAAKLQRNESNRRFDSVTLSEDGVRGSFEMELRSKLSQEVRTATSSGQVAALREQVRNGTYQVDAREIARKMLLLGEAV
ncbi:MAG: flagellar biosynthesis anti-sigma factor FlgM [Ruminococcaceae bacterium]|jgi:negative regulator of flagellin synthesis FlgM|nr:flagellar biosynthesis anti-sigma factor FlgM [Oscillospiraceae bacterium]